jgi:hypothetical protein
MDDGFEVKGLDHFYKKLYKRALKELPREAYKMLRKMGSKLRTQAARNSRKKVKKVSGNYHKGWKRGKAYKKSGSGDYQIRIGNTSKHAHLVEKGHRIVDKNGNENGYKKGVPVLEDTVKEFEKKDMKDFIEEWLDSLVGEFKL